MRYRLSTLCWLALIVAGAPSICVVIFSPRQSDACQAEDAARSQIAMLCYAVALYTLHVGEIPPDLNSLRAAPGNLPLDAKWQGPYLEKPIPVDPWGHTYRYLIDGQGPGTIRISSCGKDGISGTKDDVSSDVFGKGKGAARPSTWNPWRG